MSAPLTTGMEPAGLASLIKLAEVLCEECEVTAVWDRTTDPDTYRVTLEGKEKRLTFQFTRADIEDPDGKAFSDAAAVMTDRCTREFKPTRPS